MNFAGGSAELCAMPGGIAEMILLSGQARADQGRVAIVQATRIAPLILISLFWSPCSALRRPPLLRLRRQNFLSKTFCGWPVALPLGLAANRCTRLPAPLIIVPMAASAALHVTGTSGFTIPEQRSGGVQVFVGINVGARFLGTPLRSIQGAAMAAGLQVAIAAAAVLAAARISGWDPLALMLAYAPGGLAEMSLVAVATGQEAAFAGTHHIGRVLLALLVATLLISALQRVSGGPNEGQENDHGTHTPAS